MSKPILVIKFGSASITGPGGELNEPVLREIARQVAVIHKDYRIVLVSSGAVASGKRYLKHYSGTITGRKAAASIGNPFLMNRYAAYFGEYGIPVAQNLCERRHFSNRTQFLQLQRTYGELWANDVIPIANENDVVSDVELKFSDNDELATLIAVGFGASLLVFTTSVPGVLDQNGEVVRLIGRVDQDALALAGKEKSAVGLGGMVSKLTFTRLATRMGIRVVIAGMSGEDGLLKAIREERGTVCPAQPCSIPARKKWLASGSLVTGRVKIDEGACRALRHRKSLLGVGIVKVTVPFECGEVFEMTGPDNQVIGVGLAKIASESLLSRSTLQNVEVAHADDIVLL
jgi:glutamate 5-kinase